MINLEAYWRGYNETHFKELTPEIYANAEVTVAKVNELLKRSNSGDIDSLNSGWRPRAVNAGISSASTTSKHLSGEAADIPDPFRLLANWCASHQSDLEEIGLWCEDFRWTPTWVHVQIVPPKSAKRIYIPSLAAPLDPTFPVTWA